MENFLEEYDSFLDEIKKDNTTKIDFIDNLKMKIINKKLIELKNFIMF
jgi:hypothetical protein